MIHDVTASQLSTIMNSLARLDDSDELPANLKWSDWAQQHPEAVSWTLEALGKKKLSAAFRAEYRRQMRSGLDRAKSRALSPLILGLLTIDTKRLPLLPPGSFLLQAKVTLEQPMMTRDDRLFSVSDNAVRKDRVFGWPHIAASSWKGAFRASIYHMGLNTKEVRTEFDRIWGTASDSSEDEESERDGRQLDADQTSRAGRLNFYSTFFQHVDFRMLNPQDRVQKSGTIPIELEVVPEGNSGWFQLLYVPFDKPSAEVLPEVMADWSQVISQAVHCMLRRTGFGAKVSLGFGVMRDKVESGTLSAVGSDYQWKGANFQQLSQLPELKLPGMTV